MSSSEARDAAARIVEESRQQHDFSINVFRLTWKIRDGLADARAEGYAAGRREGLREAAAVVRAFTFMVEDASEVSLEQVKRITDAFIAEREELAAELDRMAAEGAAEALATARADAEREGRDA